MTMPTFLVIGANKAGTTSLYYYLKQHPQIFMSPVKEPMFFSLTGKPVTRKSPGHDRVLNGATYDLESYQALFAGVTDEIAIGEASTSYIHCPLCADRIKEYVPDIKLVAILRNPADRAYSNYWHYVRWGMETLGFEEAVNAEHRRLTEEKYPMGWGYVKLGMYAESVRYFLKVFRRDQIAFHLFDDFTADPAAVVRDIYGFLGVDTSFCPDVSRRFNVSFTSKHKEIAAFWERNDLFSRIVSFVIPAALRHTMRNLFPNAGDAGYAKPAMSPAMRKKLIEVYRDDIRELERLIQKDLSCWLR